MSEYYDFGVYKAAAQAALQACRNGKYLAGDEVGFLVSRPEPLKSVVCKPQKSEVYENIHYFGVCPTAARARSDGKYFDASRTYVYRLEFFLVIQNVKTGQRKEVSSNPLFLPKKFATFLQSVELIEAGHKYNYTYCFGEGFLQDKDLMRIAKEVFEEKNPQWELVKIIRSKLHMMEVDKPQKSEEVCKPQKSKVGKNIKANALKAEADNYNRNLQAMIINDNMTRCSNW